ncbi:MAG: GtrA family protein, partial [Oscillospiraceae bacterium]
MVSYLGAGVYLAQTLGYSVGILNSYVINRSWTFKTRAKFFGTQLVKFIAVNLGLLLVSLGVIWLVNGQLGLHKLIAKVCAT